MRRAVLVLAPLRAVRAAPISRAFAAAAKPADALLPGKPFAECTVGVPRETDEGERRVAAVPESVAALIKKGFKVKVERGAGEGVYGARRRARAACALISFSHTCP
jgi:hypothetical protein